MWQVVLYNLLLLFDLVALMVLMALCAHFLLVAYYEQRFRFLDRMAREGEQHRKALEEDETGTHPQEIRRKVH